jgi:tRNA pseudouridine synthase 10
MQQGIAYPESERCSLCGDVFKEVERWAKRAAAEAEGWEYHTYLIGTRVPVQIIEAEADLRKRYGLDPAWAEPFKQTFNREVGRQLGLLLAQENRTIEVDFREPNINFKIDLERDTLSFRVNPLFIYGRYRKRVRNIPQTHWPCRSCRGRGCPHCNDTGKQYAESVEELIAQPILAATQGMETHLHGAGREDIDARMLGDGRPFVLEVKEPRRRDIALAALEEAINESTIGKVEVRQLRLVKRALVTHVKETKAEKTYQALVALEDAIPAAKLADALTALLGPIEQRTPQRVSHRRADRVRRRHVLELNGHLVNEKQALLRIRCEGGLYVKELVSGDEGRTRPSLSELLQTRAQVIELDVLEVRVDFPDVGPPPMEPPSLR